MRESIKIDLEQIDKAFSIYKEIANSSFSYNANLNNVKHMHHLLQAGKLEVNITVSFKDDDNFKEVVHAMFDNSIKLYEGNELSELEISEINKRHIFWYRGAKLGD